MRDMKKPRTRGDYWPICTRKHSMVLNGQIVAASMQYNFRADEGVYASMTIDDVGMAPMENNWIGKDV
jgi:hypothetical protein